MTTEKVRATDPLPEPPEPATVQDPATARRDAYPKLRTCAVVSICGAAAAVAGAFLPGVRATAPFVGPFTVSGMDDGGGGEFFPADQSGAPAGSARDGRPVRPRPRPRPVGVRHREVADQRRRGRLRLISASVGSGLIMIGVGALAALAAALQMPRPAGDTGGSA